MTDFIELNKRPLSLIRNKWFTAAMEMDTCRAMIMACLEHNLVHLAITMPFNNQNIRFSLRSYLNKLYSPPCADVLGVLVDRLVEHKEPSYEVRDVILTGPTDYSLVLSLRTRTLNALTGILDHEKHELCVKIAHYYPEKAKEMKWFECRPGFVVNAEIASRCAVRMGSVHIVHLLVERARAASMVSGVRIASWYFLMYALAEGECSRSYASSILSILEDLRPSGADVDLSQTCFFHPGPLEAMAYYLDWDDVEDPDPDDALWRAIQISRRRYDRFLLPPAPERLSTEHLDPTSHAHQPELCLSAWTPILHAQAGQAARRSTAALLATRRPSTVAALRLGRATVDAHRLFVVPESQ